MSIEIKIAVIDDEPSVLTSLSRLIRILKYDVYTTSSKEDLMNFIKSNQVALVISDEKMPEISGHKLLEQVKEISPDTVRIILTGHADTQTVIDAINRGYVFRFLTKPWDIEIFTNTIEEAIEKYRLKYENQEMTVLIKKQNEELKDLNQNLEQKISERTKEIQKLNFELEHSFIAAVKLVAEINEYHSKAIGNHSKRVAAYSKEIAKELNLSKRDIFECEIAGILHDIGKIVIENENIKDDATKQKLYEEHPVKGEAISKLIPNIGNVPLIIRHHHENYNGSGFPDALNQQNIPLISRILRVANDFDNFLNGESTFQNVTPHMAYDEIEKFSNQYYDSNIVQAFKKFLAKKISSMNFEEIEVLYKDLKENMVLSRDLITHRGVFLLHKNTVLRAATIAKITAHQKFDPVVNGIFIYRKSKVKDDE